MRLVGPDESTLSDAPRTCPSCGRTFPADYLVCPRDGAPLGVAANESDPLIGTVLGGSYRLDRAIARGGMGRLYQATHTRLPRKVAVKVLHEPHAQRAEAVRRFEREASALCRLDHPNVLSVLDFLRTADGRGAIVTPLLEGQTLEARLAREGKLEGGVAVHIALEMCRGLSAAHSEGIVHRDLKPSNVFLVERGSGPSVVKLLDFGVAKLDGDDMTRTGVVLGTPAYMAPEQASGSAHVDARADVYAVGAVLYRMLVGVAPYEGPDASNVLSQLLSGAPERLGARAAIPAALEAIVERAMAREPSERFANIEALSDALEHLEVQSHASTGRAPARSAVPRERALAGAMIAITSAIAALLLAAFVQSASRVLEIESERALALRFALLVVGTVGAAGGTAWHLGRVVRARFGSATSLALLRSRVTLTAGVGFVAIGVAQLSLMAFDRLTPAAALTTLALGSMGAALTALTARR